MRFILVDRIVGLEPGRSIQVVKNVAASEDVFRDHFPGYPIFPGALIVEVFDQASQLLIGISGGFARVGRLERVARASFRHLVRPGDRIQARCERLDARDGAESTWQVAATAEVDGRPVASARLQYAVADARPGSEAEAQARRVAARARELRNETDALIQMVS